MYVKLLKKKKEVGMDWNIFSYNVAVGFID